MDNVSSEIGDPNARAYYCSYGLGVVIEPNGQFSDYDASSEIHPTSALTAAQVAAQIIALIRAQEHVQLKQVDCGSSANVTNGDVLRCQVTMPSGLEFTFPTTVALSGKSVRITLGNPEPGQ